LARRDVDKQFRDISPFAGDTEGADEREAVDVAAIRVIAGRRPGKEKASPGEAERNSLKSLKTAKSTFRDPSQINGLVISLRKVLFRKRFARPLAKRFISPRSVLFRGRNARSGFGCSRRCKKATLAQILATTTV
jgi:hypothetical protein